MTQMLALQKQQQELQLQLLKDQYEQQKKQELQLKQHKDQLEQQSQLEKQQEMFFEWLIKKTTEEKNIWFIHARRYFIFQEITFQSYRRYKGIFKKDCSHWNDEKKIRLLSRKLSTAEHEEYVNFILPKQPGKVNFEETIGMLTKIFRDNFIIHSGISKSSKMWQQQFCQLCRSHQSRMWEV